jgi:hypothetical protein
MHWRGVGWCLVLVYFIVLYTAKLKQLIIIIKLLFVSITIKCVNEYLLEIVIIKLYNSSDMRKCHVCKRQPTQVSCAEV